MTAAGRFNTSAIHRWASLPDASAGLKPAVNAEHQTLSHSAGHSHSQGRGNSVGELSLSWLQPIAAATAATAAVYHCSRASAFAISATAVAGAEADADADAAAAPILVAAAAVGSLVFLCHKMTASRLVDHPGAAQCCCCNCHNNSSRQPPGNMRLGNHHHGQRKPAQRTHTGVRHPRIQSDCVYCSFAK